MGSKKTPKPPEESASVIRARERQVMDLAKIDEEENRRIKQLRSVSRGVRAFRGIRSVATAARNGSPSGGSAGVSSGGSAGTVQTVLPGMSYTDWGR